jgi:hypothetical protein
MQQETFRRTWSARLAPTFLAAGASGLLVTDAAAGELRLSWWTATVAVLGLVALGAALLAWGDRVTVDEAGLHVDNALLRRLGRQRRSLSWSRLRAVRPFHGPLRSGVAPEPGRGPRALFVSPDAGRRWVLDSLQGMERLQALLEARLPPPAPARRPPAL